MTEKTLPRSDGKPIRQSIEVTDVDFASRLEKIGKLKNEREQRKTEQEKTETERERGESGKKKNGRKHQNPWTREFRSSPANSTEIRILMDCVRANFLAFSPDR